MSQLRHAIKDDRWHVLNRPNVYIGSIQEGLYNEYLIEKGKMEQVEIVYIPALIKIINEVIDNSVDILAKRKNGRIDITMTDTSITIKDNGPGMPIFNIQDLDGSDILLPRAMWGKAKAGSNFNGDSEDATTIGTNGVGSYCANVWSKKFVGTSCDGKKLFTGTWLNNDTEYEDTVIDKITPETGCTVYFEPDLERFKIDKIDISHKLIIQQRIINLSFLFDNIDFYFNNNLIKWTKADYISTFNKEGVGFELFENNKYSIAIMSSKTDNFESFSIINGLNIKGGTHIDYIQKKTVKSIQEKLPAKFADIKPGDIKNKLQILVFGKEFPEIQWQGQTKENIGNDELSIQYYFGNDWEKILAKVSKNRDIINGITELYEIKLERELRKEKKEADKELKKHKPLKLRDATESKDFLALVEGDSALNGITGGVSRDFVGFLPLKGVPQNPLNNETRKIMFNDEYKDLMTALNFKFDGKNDIKKMAYKNIVTMTDADHDGSHIQGILHGFISKFLPDAYQAGKVYRFLTPIKVAKDKKDKLVYAFFNEQEYEKAGKEGKLDKLYIEHKKGLGSMSDDEYAEFFSLYKFEECLQQVKVKDNDFNLLHEWLLDNTSFRKEQILSKPVEQISTIDKRGIKTIELNNFLDTDYRDWARYRAFQRIPFFIDLLAESQRKVMHTMLEKNITKKMSVEDTASIVKLYTKYHHGATSLESTINNMVPEFNNNLPLLFKGGTFGTRSERKAAAGRYAETKLMPYTQSLFPKIDRIFYNEKWDDGKKIEPETLLPILPIGLINGQNQIGVGWSVDIQPRKMEDVLELTRGILRGEVKEIPHTINISIPRFNGKIFPKPNGGWYIQGIIKEAKEGKTDILHITEVPTRYVGYVKPKKNSDGSDATTSKGYINLLEELVEQKVIKSYKEKIVKDTFDIKIKGFDYNLLKDCINDDMRQLKLLEIFKLTENKSDNISVITENGSIEQFNGIGEVYSLFLHFRLGIYTKRKDYLIRKLEEDLYKMASRIEFIKGFIDNRLIITKIDDDQILKNLESYDFKFYREEGKSLISENEEANTNGEFEETVEAEVDTNPYKYLLDMKINQLTQNKINQFMKKIEEVQQELEDIKIKTPASLWLDDLDAFEKEYKKFIN